LPEDDLIQKVRAIEEGRRVSKGKVVAWKKGSLTDDWLQCL
jgi:hypothetical protein